MVVKKVVVYLGSAAGNSPVYADNAAELGHRLAQAGVEIVYGGASVGTMWTMASRGFMSAADAAIPCFCSTVDEIIAKVLAGE